MDSLPEGIDKRFLDFIKVTEESERQTHAYYLQFFQPGQQVIDLGCGAGYFVKMLAENGVEAIGIDQDTAALKEGLPQGGSLVQGEAISYLKGLAQQSIDGIFSAHLVEHLDAPAVYTLIKEAYRVLKPGGLLLLTTPNVRALVSHFEMFWLHFDHKRFYHPTLLQFFMQDCGFTKTFEGENSNSVGYSVFSPALSPSSLGHLVDQDNIIPRPRSRIMYPWWRLKKWLASLIVLPYLNAFIRRRYAPALGILDRPFEVFVIGYK